MKTPEKVPCAENLRDWFAGQALAGNLEQGIEDSMGMMWFHEPNKIAFRAYEIADAMLKVRGMKS